jgi:hypothetical protein
LIQVITEGVVLNLKQLFGEQHHVSVAEAPTYVFLLSFSAIGGTRT